MTAANQAGDGQVSITFTAGPATTTTTVAPGTRGTPAAGGTTTTPALAFTGLNLLPLLATGGLLIAAGACMVATATPRGRRRHQRA